jgi:hypothetical protein
MVVKRFGKKKGKKKENPYLIQRCLHIIDVKMSFSRVAMGRTWSAHKPTLDFFHTWCPHVGTIVGRRV